MHTYIDKVTSPAGEQGPTMKVRFNLLWRASLKYEGKIQPPGGELGPPI